MAQVAKCVQDACDLAVARVRFEGGVGVGFENEQLEEMVKIGGGFPHNHTEIIREATRLYTETWIVSLLQAIANGDTRYLRRSTDIHSDQAMISKARKERLDREEERI